MKMLPPSLPLQPFNGILSLEETQELHLLFIYVATFLVSLRWNPVPLSCTDNSAQTGSIFFFLCTVLFVRFQLFGVVSRTTTGHVATKEDERA